MVRNTILSGSCFSLGENNGMRFSLKCCNWNDYGYYTLYSLEIRLPNSYSSRPWLCMEADIRVMNIGQKKGVKPSWEPSTPIVFISNVDSAEKIFLTLSPEQRKKLEDILLICYDTRQVEKEGAFINSVLRDKTKEEFIYEQSRIKELMHSSIDVRTLVGRHNYQLNLFLSDIKDRNQGIL